MALPWARLGAVRPSHPTSSSVFLLFLLLSPISYYPPRSKVLWPCASPKQAWTLPSIKVRLRGKLLASPAATPGFRLTSGCWRCQALGTVPLLLGTWRGWETLHRGCPSLRSGNLVNRFSYLKNKLPTPLTKLCLAIPLAHYKEKSWFALLDLLNLGSSLHQFAEQGCLVLKHQWFMVSHVLMGYIIHLVLVHMNISSRDRSACWGVGWHSAVC